NYFLHLKLGTASSIISILFAVSGFIGFFKVFNFFLLPRTVTIPALLMIMLSDSFYSSFIFYQGGEILSFGVFPWFLLYILKIERPTTVNLVLTGVFFTVCFVAKITLCLYCALVILFKAVEPPVAAGIRGRKLNIRDFRFFLFFIPVVIASALILQGFLLKGLHIPFFNGFHFGPEDIIIPATAPFLSLLSLQTVFLRIDRLGTHFFPFIYQQRVYLLLCIFSAAGFVLLLLAYSKLLPGRFKLLLTILLTGIFSYFALAYIMETGIDQSARHYKLAGYLLTPALVIALQKVSRFSLPLVLGFFFILSTGDYIYTKRKWTAGRYVNINNFYRNHDNLEWVDRLPETVYRQLIALDKTTPVSINGKPVVFFVEATPDISIDLNHLTVFDLGRQGQPMQSYAGNGAVVYLVVSRKTALTNNFLQQLLPDYSGFTVFAEKDDYLFIRTTAP
ncbi:MAG: hypothetical protein QM664_11405, partial [Flavihumibacter sp.]